jgi:hypothetical protein
MNAAVGRIYTNDACAVYLDVSTPQGSELPQKDVSGQQEPLLFLDVSPPQGPNPHLDSDLHNFRKLYI